MALAEYSDQKADAAGIGWQTVEKCSFTPAEDLVTRLEPD